MSFCALVVEDDHSMRVVTKQTLLRIGLGIERVYEAANGREGLEKIRARPVGLVLTDINMPVMNGLEMLDHMRKDPNIANIPTVVMSSVKDKKIVNTLIESGLGYVQKPFRPLLLKKQIQSLEIRYELRL